MKTRAALPILLVLWTYAAVAQTVLKYYGVDDIEISKFSFVRDSLKGNFALVELASDTVTWKSALAEAEKNNLKLIIWPMGNGQRYTPFYFDFTKWLIDPTKGWDISQGLNVLQFAERYITSGGQALVAVVTSHEPYYAQGEQVFNSSQLKALYSTIKNVAPHVKTYIYMNDMAYYDRTDPSRRMEDGIMDICGTYKHSFGTKNTEAETLQEIDDDYDLIQRKGLHMQLFFALQTFGYSTPDYRMPLASEMQALATKILEKRKLDGAFWYPWNRVSTSYVSWLSKDRYDSTGADRWSVVTQLSKYLSVTDVEKGSAPPVHFSLSQNYPNPFNPTTVISYRLSAVSFVTLKVYDVLGVEVATLVNGELQAGSYQATFDASRLSTGVYLCQLRAAEFLQTRKMVLVK